MGTDSTFLTISAVFLLMFRNFIFCSADNLQFFEGSSMEITDATNCEHEPVGKGVMTKYVKVSKYNRTHHHVYCNFTIPFYFDDSVMLDLDVKRKLSSGATVNVIKFQTPFCKFLDRHFKDAIRKMYESGGHYGIDGCPVPAGTYVFDSDLDLKVTNLPYTPFGDYHATAIFYKAGVNRKKFFCIKIIFQIKKKISTNKQDNIFSMDNS